MESLIPGPVSTIKLMAQIWDAVNIASENKDECREIKDRIVIINKRMGRVTEDPTMLQDQEMQLALSGTYRVLLPALNTIRKQKRGNAATRIFLATGNARHLTGIKEKHKHWGDEIHKAMQSYQYAQGQSASNYSRLPQSHVCNTFSSNPLL
jgi:hypothetical protein